MSTTIYYFTGTGNSYVIASKIAAKAAGRLVPIASLLGNDEIEVDADCIGLVFPVYYGDLPNIVARFVPKLRALAGRYVFAVSTYGGGKGDALKSIEALVESGGGRLAAFYGLHMPQNAFSKPWDSAARLYRRADEMVALIDRNLDARAEGVFVSEWLMDLVQAPVYVLLKPLSRRQLIKAAGGQKTDSLSESIYRLDRSFTASEACTGCGVCARVCPAQNIAMQLERPVWLHHCENCLACANFCPQQAIHTGLTAGDYHYRHPDYSLREAQAQRP